MAKELSQWISFLIRNSSNSGTLFALFIFRSPLTSHCKDQRCWSTQIKDLVFHQRSSLFCMLIVFLIKHNLKPIHYHRFVHQRLKCPPKIFKPTLQSLGHFWLGTLALTYLNYREFKTKKSLPPIWPNISTNIRWMRTFQVTILCPCMLGCWLYSVETNLNWKWWCDIKPSCVVVCVVGWPSALKVKMGAKLTPKMMRDDNSPK